jgi:ABC-type multidrug transport system permease subunit
MPFFIIMCELFNGVLQPHDNMPAFWAYTMYYATPFTYWIGGVLTSVLRGMPVVCSESELTLFQSPPNMTCGEYAGPWLSEKGVGYLSNPDGMDECGYCEYNYGDDVSCQLAPLDFCFFVLKYTDYLASIFPESASIHPRSGPTLASFWRL